jgi:hypothetical protein
LRMREQKLRDTNESTNERVKWFSLGTMGVLVSLGGWQVVYLRAYFRYVSFISGRTVLLELGSCASLLVYGCCGRRRSFPIVCERPHSLIRVPHHRSKHLI